MRLWTIQKYPAYQYMLKTDILAANEEYVFEKEFYAPVYAWLYNQMVNRIGEPPQGIKYPIWAWFQWEGKRSKPDMRRSGHSKPGEKVVRLTIEVNEKDVLLADFDLYHYPLNYWYIPLNEDDDRKAEEKCPALSFEQSIRREFILQPSKDPRFYEMMTKSWERIFDLSLEDDGWLFNKMDKKSIQATMWQIKREQILDVEEFIAR